MAYTLEDIKHDLSELDERQFYLKYIVRSENWYFENVLKLPSDKAMDDLKIIVGDMLGVSYNSVLMVGSGKTGYSFSPEKHLKPFTIDPAGEQKSDIDIAIISSPIFEQLWKSFRQGYNIKNQAHYSYISRGIYRGYIDERNINQIKPCRLLWKDLRVAATKKLQQNMYFQHDINYRIYRSWEDFEEYTLGSISQLKYEVMKNGN